MVVTLDTEYGTATVRDLPTGVKAVLVMRPDKSYRVGTIAPMANGKFYAVPVAGATYVAHTLTAAAEWLSSVYGDRNGWES